MQNCSRQQYPPPPPAVLMLWEHDIGREGDRGYVGGMMVHQKGELWGFTGNSIFCPSKPMQWPQRADTFPIHT
eukprot:2303633-Ditylum_brightwellii.AAC.1